MKLAMYQSVRLKTGERGVIIEIFNDGEGYMVDIRLADGNYDQKTVCPSDIQSVFAEVEQPYATA